MKKILLLSLIAVFAFSLNSNVVTAYSTQGCNTYNPVSVSAEPDSGSPGFRSVISIDATRFLSCVISAMNTKDWVASFVFDFGDGTKTKVFLAPGDSYTSSRGHVYSTAGTYTASVTADAGGPGGPFPETSTDSATITVTAPPPSPSASMTHTASVSSVDVGGSVSASGSGTNVTSCTRSSTPPPTGGFPNVDYSGTALPPGGGVGNVTVASKTVTGFSKATTGTSYYLNLECFSDRPFASLDQTSNLARALEPFLGFVKVAYAAATSKTISLPVNVNALPNAVLNVNSSGASGVSISGLSGAPSGTTNYSSSQTSTISGTLLAPASSGGKDFTGWSGCNSASGYTCNVSVSPGNTKTVTVYYAAVPPPSTPNLRISGISLNPSSPAEGVQVDFSATVVNDGDGSAGSNSTTKLKIDLYDNGGGSIWDQTSNKTTGNLASGGSETETWNNVWTAVAGFHRIRVCADAGNGISESNESDNCTDTYVTVNSSDATLNVTTSGTLYATTVYSSTGQGGTTNYTYTSPTAITNAHLVGQLTSGSYEFVSWTGCDTVPPNTPNQCYVSVSPGATKNLVANYSLPAVGFDYSLSNSGTSSATKGSVDVYTQNTITKTLTSGSSQSVNLSVSGVPSGVTTSFSNKTCSPTCNSTITFTVSPSAPTGNHNITITGSSPTRTTNFTLAITGSAMSIDCVPSPATAMIGQPVTWTANVTGGTAPYTYSWSGSGIPTNPAPDVNPYSVTYSTTGQKNATVQVTDDNSQTASCPANSSAQINFNPSFEEF